MRREVIPRCADRAGPVFESEIDLAMRVKHCLALFADDWLVFDKGHVFNLFERSIDSTDRYDNSCLSDLVARPVVP